MLIFCPLSHSKSIKSYRRCNIINSVLTFFYPMSIKLYWQYTQFRASKGGHLGNLNGHWTVSNRYSAINGQHLDMFCPLVALKVNQIVRQYYQLRASERGHLGCTKWTLMDTVLATWCRQYKVSRYFNTIKYHIEIISAFSSKAFENK